MPGRCPVGHCTHRAGAGPIFGQPRQSIYWSDAAQAQGYRRDIDRAPANKRAKISTSFYGRSLLNVTVTALSRGFSPTAIRQPMPRNRTRRPPL